MSTADSSKPINWPPLTERKLPVHLGNQQWLEIEMLYRSGERVDKIADAYGVTESSIRKRASRYQWTRNPSEYKRQLVEAAMTGLAEEANKIASERKRSLQEVVKEQAQVDAQALQIGAEVFRRALEKLRVLIEEQSDERGVKTVSEAARVALDGYRRARNLDDSGMDPDSFESWARERGIL